ncbi:BRCT protein [human gut metagenome]|uniref:BRCT protein n=1 Tax=human gut metagenome TaxID=408170 RepID=W1YBX3_9ZZZZ
MNNMILIDLETQSFEVESGIYEVAALAVKNGEIIDKLYLAIVEDESLIHEGFGAGFKEISNNTEIMNEFKTFLNKYSYPLVAHNGSFDRKFLVYYNWIDENYPFYDSIRAIKYKNPKLFSYSLEYLIDFFNINSKKLHHSMNDVLILNEILNIVKPDIWVPIGFKNKKSNLHNYKLDNLKIDFEVVKNLFVGKNIVFTGKGPYTRNELIELAKKCGADISSNNITKKTNLLVVGEKPGSKLQKANEKGIEVMDMSDFFEMTSGIKLDKSDEEKIKEISETLNSSNPQSINTSTILYTSDKLSGQVITLFPMKESLTHKVSKIVERHGGIALSKLRLKETTLLVYQSYAKEFETVKKAQSKNIETMSLGKFNRLINDIENS